MKVRPPQSVSLRNVITYKWKALSVEQHVDLMNYISDVTIQLSSNEISFHQQRLYVDKLNIILVQVLKHEWPARWTTFIPDLTVATRNSETTSKNCMAILKVCHYL